MSAELPRVWIFSGEGAAFPGGVFSSLESAESWIHTHQLSGVLTAYPVDIGVYEWALARGTFRVTKDKHAMPSFIGGFSSAYLEHYHYKAGQRSG
jgi:hypothetical protein